MAVNYTPRVALAKPDQDEFQLIDVLNGNMDKLDTMIGSRMVAAGVIPPPNQLYDGCIVNERDTGKTWVASSNGAGGFDRAWIRYPWYIYTMSQTAATLANGVGLTLPVVFGSGNNASATDVVANRVVIPISGIYRVDFNMTFGGNASSNSGGRILQLVINGGIYALEGKYFPFEPNGVSDQFQFDAMPQVFAAGTTVQPRAYQSSGGAMGGCVARMAVTLISVTGKNNN